MKDREEVYCLSSQFKQIAEGRSIESTLNEG